MPLCLFDLFKINTWVSHLILYNQTLLGQNDLKLYSPSLLHNSCLFCQVRALLTEELLEKTRRVKEENLRQFQDAVRRRVSEQARICKQQQLQKSYKTVSEETHKKKSVLFQVTFTPVNLFSQYHFVDRHILCKA